MNRWHVPGGLAVLLLIGALSGCQPTFMTKEMYQEAHAPLSRDLENNSCPITEPLSSMTPAPATVNRPDRPPRYLTLQEAIAISLENGHASGRAGGGLGFVDNNLASFAGGSLNAQTERIRVLALNPAIASAAMEASIARYDPVWISSISWTGTDSISGVPNLPGYLGTVPGQTATFQSSVVKAFPTGGVAQLSFLTDYRLLNNQANNPFAFGPLNPQYSARISVGFEQPLWRDWGVDINNLLSRFPNILGQGLVGNAAFTGYNQHQNAVSAFVDRQTEGILISRLRFDQHRAEFERSVHLLMVNAEVAYWNLYNKYGQLYAFEENLRIMHRAWQDNYSRFKAGTLAPENYQQVLGQYREFQGERMKALNEVLKAEQQLRGILGLPVEDGSRIVPISAPTLAELKPEWETSLHDALNLRPELVLARHNLRYHQHLLTIQKNNMKPDLRAFGRYEPFGDGSTLTGNGTFTDASGTLQPTNAFRSLSHSHLADFTLGLNLNIPLGYRFEMAAVRAARLELTQSYYLLKDQEDKTARYLADQVREVEHWYERIKIHRGERMGYRDSLLTRYNLSVAGKITIGDPAFLEAQRRYAAALVKEYEAISEYNNSLARLEWAKGTILRYNNVHIAEGALPQCVQGRAVEIEKERTRSKVLRERPDSLHQPGRLCHETEKAPVQLDLPEPEEKIGAPKQIIPVSNVEKAKIVTPALTPRPLEERLAPRSKEEKAIDFRPQSTSPREPGPLPQLITPDRPVLELLPANTK